MNSLLLTVTSLKAVEKTQPGIKSTLNATWSWISGVEISIASVRSYRALKLNEDRHSKHNVLFIFHLALLYSSNNIKDMSWHRSQYEGFCFACCLTVRGVISSNASEQIQSQDHRSVFGKHTQAANGGLRFTFGYVEGSRSGSLAFFGRDILTCHSMWQALMAGSL